LESNAKTARERLWTWQKRLDVKEEGQRILSRHVRLSSHKKTRLIDQPT
jgi:deoxyribodipyrimidine photo-lyase